jgi:hypothetical protein
MPNSKRNTVVIFNCDCGKTLKDYTTKGMELKIRYHKQICPELENVVIHQAQQARIELDYGETFNNLRRPNQ